MNADALIAAFEAAPEHVDTEEARVPKEPGHWNGSAHDEVARLRDRIAQLEERLRQREAVWLLVRELAPNLERMLDAAEWVRK